MLPLLMLLRRDAGHWGSGSFAAFVKFGKFSGKNITMVKRGGDKEFVKRKKARLGNYGIGEFEVSFK